MLLGSLHRSPSKPLAGSPREGTETPSSHRRQPLSPCRCSPRKVPRSYRIPHRWFPPPERRPQRSRGKAGSPKRYWTRRPCRTRQYPWDAVLRTPSAGLGGRAWMGQVSGGPVPGVLRQLLSTPRPLPQSDWDCALRAESALEQTSCEELRSLEYPSAGPGPYGESLATPSPKRLTNL